MNPDVDAIWIKAVLVTSVPWAIVVVALWLDVDRMRRQRDKLRDRLAEAVQARTEMAFRLATARARLRAQGLMPGGDE